MSPAQLYHQLAVPRRCFLLLVVLLACQDYGSLAVQMVLKDQKHPKRSENSEDWSTLPQEGITSLRRHIKRQPQIDLNHALYVY